LFIRLFGFYLYGIGLMGFLRFGFGLISISFVVSPISPRREAFFSVDIRRIPEVIFFTTWS
jgi:hypothetical protein